MAGLPSRPWEFLADKKKDDWMFGTGGPPKEEADVTAQPTDRLESIQQGEPPPVAKPVATPVAKPVAKPEPKAPPSKADELKQKVLDHTAKLRRALLEGTKPPPPPAPPPAPVAE